MATNMKSLNGYGFDASKLGGMEPRYYLYRRNLLDNSYWRVKSEIVNQRGKEVYPHEGSKTHSIDRWYTWHSSEVTTIHDGYISTTVQLMQTVPNSRITDGSVYTVALCNADGTVYVASGRGDTYFGVWGHIWYETHADGTHTVTIQDSGNHVWAALYEGEYTADTLPPYVPKGYAAELAECQRYFLALNGVNIGIAHPYTATDAYVTLYVPTRMQAIPRIDPTNLRISNHDFISDGNASIANISNVHVSNTTITFFANTPDTLSTGRLYGVSGRGDVYISADL